MKRIFNFPAKAFRYVISLIAKDYPKPGEAFTQFWYMVVSFSIVIASFITLILIS
jgi:hypothetical protein